MLTVAIRLPEVLRQIFTTTYQGQSWILTIQSLHLYLSKLHYRKEVKGKHMFPLNYMANITLDLYRTPSDERMVSKTLNDKFSFDKINLKQDCSITHPVFVLGKTSSTEPMDTVGWWRKFNYC